MSVNLSARQFAQPGLAGEVAAILAETGLDPASLELEITESVLMDESEAGTRSLRELRELGVKLALDDFGTGYSSLSYLKHLPLDALKIDRTFIAELTGADDTTLPIVEAVIALAHGLGIGRRRRGDRDGRAADLAAPAVVRPRPGLLPRPTDAGRRAARPSSRPVGRCRSGAASPAGFPARMPVARRRRAG